MQDRTTEIYDNPLTKKLFEEAYKKYPKYNNINSSDHEEAVVFILEGMDARYQLNEEERDKLNDMVSGGLA